MSSSSSIISISSHSLDLFRKSTTSPALSVPFTSHFAGVKSSGLKKSIINAGSSWSYSVSEIPTPNSSVLSEDESWGQNGFGKDSLAASESECESKDDNGDVLADGGSDYELALSNLGLPMTIVDSLQSRGITRLLPIQRSVLEPAIEGRDIIARAKTGTGKTLAYGIPIIKRLTEDDPERGSQRRTGKLPRCLVLAPTRELAKQVEKEMKESAPYLTTVCIYEELSYSIQQGVLSRGADVVVGTPGRTMELIKDGALQLGDVQFLVLDEAARMFAFGSEADVEFVLDNLPTKRQIMLFSATMPTWVKKLSTKYLNDALTIDLVGDQGEKLAEGIKLYAIPTIRRSKPTILIDLITVYARGGKTIIFTQTTRGAVEALMALPNNMDSVELHDEIPQHQREIKLQGFREGKIHVIVATDVTSRFLDIPNVDLVIHYELPNDGETFLHRSVRTGRSGKEGTVILMFSIDQRRLLRSFERAVRSKFEFISAPTVEDVSRALAGQVVATLSRVQPKYVEYFIPTAQKLIDEQGTSALAAAIARLTGFSRPPSPRSLISQEQGWVTLQLTCDPDSFKGFLSVKGVKEFLSDVYSKAAERVGNIHLILDERIQGAVFELPEETANELLTKQITPGHYITKITKLPPLQVDGQVKDRSNRNVGSSRGGSRGSSSRGRFSDSDDSRDIFRRSGGGRSRSGNSWSQNSRSSGSDWRASHSPSYGNRDSNRRFEGTCFTCGESGHRSADCPSKRGN